MRGGGTGRRGPAAAGIRHHPRQQAQARPRTWPARRRRSRRPARSSPHAASRHGPGSTARRRHGRPRRSRVDAIPHGRNRRRRGRRKGRKWRRRPQAGTRSTTAALALLGAGTAGSCLFQPAARIAFRPSFRFIIQIVPHASLTHVKHRDGWEDAREGRAGELSSGCPRGQQGSHRAAYIHPMRSGIQIAMAIMMRFSVSETKPSGTLLLPPTQAHLSARLSI